LTAYSNTTPFIALASIERLDILPSVFGEIHVPQAAVDERLAGGRIIVPPLRTCLGSFRTQTNLSRIFPCCLNWIAASSRRLPWPENIRAAN